MTAQNDLTKRQTEALAWLHSVGKATPKTLKLHGYSDRTMQALVKAERAEVEWASRSPFTNFPIYRPRRDAA